MNDDLISRSALKEAIREWRYHGYYDKLIEVINNVPTVVVDTNCWHCDYFKFSQTLIENIVKLMTDYNIERVEDLVKELNHINELLGGNT